MTDSSTKTIIIQPICRLCKHPQSEHEARGCIHNAKYGYCGCQYFIPDSRRPSPTIETLEALANEQGVKIYSIFRRNAGWAIQWHEPERQEKELPGTGEESFHYGLVVYQYYPTFDEMVAEEFKRLKGV